MADGKITTLNEITNPTVSNLRQNSAINVSQIWRIVFGTVTANSVPPRTWTTIGYISSKPMDNVTFPILNASVTSFGQILIKSDGELLIYHTAESNVSFGNQLFMYIS